jgi:23S rRNA (cytosine1962-C5)-methyltransferase
MALPQVIVAPSAAQRIRHFDCWVFRDELTTPRDPPANGEVVELTDRSGTFLAYAFYSARSHVAARVVSLERGEPVDRTLISHRLKTAVSRRAAIDQTNAKRLVFSEADGLPGLIVDQYADVLVLQIRSAGMEPWRAAAVDILRDLLRPKGVLERSDKEFREEEGLPAITQVLAGTVPDRILIDEGGLQFWVDPHRGQKTGFYLDQRDTRRRVRARIQPGTRVADVCAYTGAFGIGAASRGASVVCVEQQEAFLALARDNAALNHVEERMEFVAGDAFYWLEAAGHTHDRFDWVLLDPPALANSKAETPKSRQALHRLLVHALGLLNPNGTLVLSVCTYHLLGLIEEIVRIAAAERGLRLRVQALSLQAADHPWILQMPMTRYLMSWLVQHDGRRAA